MPSNADGGRFGGGRGGRGYDALVGKCIKIKSGPYKGYRGRVKEVTGALVRVELDSLMKIVTGESSYCYLCPVTYHMLEANMTNTQLKEMISLTHLQSRRHSGNILSTYLSNLFLCILLIEYYHVISEPRYSLGGETPMHPSRTPHHAYQTPMRDPGGLFAFCPRISIYVPLGQRIHLFTHELPLVFSCVLSLPTLQVASHG